MVGEDMARDLIEALYALLVWGESRSLSLHARGKGLYRYRPDVMLTALHRRSRERDYSLAQWRA